jgi:hypothetical protein
MAAVEPSAIRVTPPQDNKVRVLADDVCWIPVIASASVNKIPDIGLRTNHRFLLSHLGGAIKQSGRRGMNYLINIPSTACA